jgi:hypothetical protein
MYLHHYQTWYYVDVPWDSPGVPGKEGGVIGETVYFSVTINTTTYAGPNATWQRCGIVYHPLRLCSECPLQGDANMDGVVNMADVDREEQIILGMADITPCADANGDGHVDMADVTCIERIILGLPC